MALPKKVKIGGSYYKGHKLDIASASGTYPIAIIATTKGYAVNGISVTPDSNGLNDTFTLEHVSTTATVGGKVIAILAEDVYNLGGGITVSFDFATLELIEIGESLRLSYLNTASVAMPIYITVETIK